MTLAHDVEDAQHTLLAKGRVLVVLTNGPTAKQQEKLARSGLTHQVDAWTISETKGGVRKPDPELFHVAAPTRSASTRW